MSAKQTLGTFQCRTKRRVKQGGAYFDAKFEGDVTVVIDIEKLVADLGWKALTSKRHTATLRSGAILLRASQVKINIERAS